MKTNVTALAAAVLALALAAAGGAAAHHSYAMFDNTKEVRLKGTIKAFGWTNPHSWIEINVPNKKGVVETWGVEMNSPNNLARQGWKRTSLKPGDKVEITVHPLRSGDNGGSFMYVTFPDGTVLREARASGEPAAKP